MKEHTDDLDARLRRSAATDSDAPALAPELVTAASSRRAPRLINHGRVTRAASVSMAAVAAVAVGSLVIAHPFTMRDPLFTAADGVSSPAAQSSAMADDARSMMWVNYEYLAGPGLSTSTGRGSVFEVQRSGTPQQVATDMAAQFGLIGDAVESEFFDPAYPTYVVGVEDGSSPSLSITWAGTGSWWYSNPGAYPPLECETVSGIDENGESFEYDDCVQPPIPADESLAPSDADARVLAAGFFGEAGLEVAPADIRIASDEWQTMAIANLKVDGVTTAIEYAIGWSPTGEIAWATGHSIDVVDRGEFDTISAVDAVERLSDWRWSGAAGPEFQGGMGIFAADSLARDAAAPVGSPDNSVSSSATEPGTDDPGTVEPGDPGTAPVEPIDPGAGEEPLPADPPTEPILEPETVVVTVDEAQPTLLLMWDSEGNAWLVPGFAMQHPDGWYNSIVSLIDGVIELPAPFKGETAPHLED